MSKGQGAILKPQARPTWLCSGRGICAEARETVMARRMDLRNIVRTVGLIVIFGVDVKFWPSCIRVHDHQWDESQSSILYIHSGAIVCSEVWP